MPHDHEIHDEDLRSEIELVSAMVVAAAEHDRPLTLEEIDAVLGVDVIRAEERIAS